MIQTRAQNKMKLAVTKEILRQLQLSEREENACLDHFLHGYGIKGWL